MPDQIIYLQASKRRQRAEKFNLFLAGMLLLLTGIDALLSSAEHIAFPWLNVLVGSIILGSVVYELKLSKHTDRRVIKWIEIVAGLALMTEAVNHYHSGKFLQPALFYLLVGIVMCGKGIFHTRWPHFRRLSVDNTGFFLRTSPFKKIQHRWDELRSIRMNKKEIRIILKNGTDHAVSLRTTGNSGEIISLLTERATARQILVE
jgi:hypothetical protein